MVSTWRLFETNEIAADDVQSDGGQRHVRIVDCWRSQELALLDRHDVEKLADALDGWLASIGYPRARA